MAVVEDLCSQLSQTPAEIGQPQRRGGRLRGTARLVDRARERSVRPVRRGQPAAGQASPDAPEAAQEARGLDAAPDRKRSVGAGPAPRDDQRDRLGMGLHVVMGGCVARRAEALGEGERRAQRALAPVRLDVERPALEDQLAGAEVRLRLDPLDQRAEQLGCRVEPQSRRMPRAQEMDRLMRLGEPASRLRLAAIDEQCALLEPDCAEKAFRDRRAPGDPRQLDPVAHARGLEHRVERRGQHAERARPPERVLAQRRAMRARVNADAVTRTGAA